MPPLPPSPPDDARCSLRPPGITLLYSAPPSAPPALAAAATPSLVALCTAMPSAPPPCLFRQRALIRGGLVTKSVTALRRFQKPFMLWSGIYHMKAYFCRYSILKSRTPNLSRLMWLAMTSNLAIKSGY